jgi:hypothetical protein
MTKDARRLTPSADNGVLVSAIFATARGGRERPFRPQTLQTQKRTVTETIQCQRDFAASPEGNKRGMEREAFA